MPDALIDSYAGKLPSLVAALDIGESASECRRFTIDELTAEMLIQYKQKCRNRGTAAVARAKGRMTGGKWEMEVSDFRTASHHIAVCLLITRVQ